MLLLISIHAPRTGSDATDGRCTTIARHFNPRSPHGERLLENAKKELAKKFQSTLPARGATLQRQHIAAGIPHFNPRSPHGERPCSARRCGLLRPISIHAPRTGSDGICIVFSFRQYGRISIHAPRTGSDCRRIRCARSVCISIHAPRTGSDGAISTGGKGDAISIHAPRTGSDNAEANQKFRAISISIHAPRTGSDLSLLRFPANVHDFNPRSPHGERPDRASPSGGQGYFNPRAPHGERPCRELMRREQQ